MADPNLILGTSRIHFGEKTIIGGFVTRLRDMTSAPATAASLEETLGIQAELLENLSLSGKWMTSNKIHPDRLISDADIEQAAVTLGVEVAVVKAFDQVETKQYGFLKSGKPTILFETDKFAKYAPEVNPKAYPLIATKKGYLGGESEWRRFDLAGCLNFEAAVKATSFGRYQVLGESYKAAGYKTVHDFFIDMMISEHKHLNAFVNYVISKKSLHTAMKVKDWKTMAKDYNGRDYAKNKYDTKLEAAYYSFSSMCGPAR
jgi:hypothetical protein